MPGAGLPLSVPALVRRHSLKAADRQGVTALPELPCSALANCQPLGATAPARGGDRPGPRAQEGEELQQVGGKCVSDACLSEGNRLEVNELGTHPRGETAAELPWQNRAGPGEQRPQGGRQKQAAPEPCTAEPKALARRLKSAAQTQWTWGADSSNNRGFKSQDRLQDSAVVSLPCVHKMNPESKTTLLWSPQNSQKGTINP